MRGSIESPVADAYLFYRPHSRRRVGETMTAGRLRAVALYWWFVDIGRWRPGAKRRLSFFAEISVVIAEAVLLIGSACRIAARRDYRSIFPPLRAHST
jgi:hypothetical protein